MWKIPTSSRTVGNNSPERNDDSCQLLVADADASRNDSATEQADHADPESCLAL